MAPIRRRKRVKSLVRKKHGKINHPFVNAIIAIIKDAFVPLENISEGGSLRRQYVQSTLQLIKAMGSCCKIAFMFPYICDNPDTIAAKFSGTHYEEFPKLLIDFLKDEKSWKQPLPKNMKLVRLLDYCAVNWRLMEYLTEYTYDHSDIEKGALKAINKLLELASKVLRYTAERHTKWERYIYELLRQKVDLQKKINTLSGDLHLFKTKLQWKLAAQNCIVRKIELDQLHKRSACQNVTRSEIANSNARITVMKIEHEAEMLALQEQLDSKIKQREQSHHHCARQRKQALDEFNKLTSQVCAQIKKYDEYVSDRVRENLYMESAYEKELEEFDQLMVIFSMEQQEHYDQVVVKYEEEERVRTEKRALFSMNRAARIIQKFWREFHKQQKAKPKTRQGSPKGKRK